MGHPAIYSAVCGNQYFHQMRFAAKGDYIPTHEHTYPHVLQVVRGRLLVAAGDERTEVGANQFFDVPAGVEHGLLALEDDTFAQCTHVMRWPDGTVVPFDYKLSARERLEITGAL